MKNIKKIITIVLCMLLIISSGVMVNAEESDFSGIVSKKVEVLGDGDVTVLIDIAGNPGITALKLWVSYDTKVLTVEEDGIRDTELLAGKIENTFIKGRFPVSWQDSEETAANNYNNGTIAEIDFKMAEGFYGTTEVTIEVEFAQNLVNDKFDDAPPMEGGIISVTREKFAVKNGEVIANDLKGETLIIASYDENGMTDCKVYPDSTGNLKFQVAELLDLTGATKVKAFLWENMKNLVPVCNFAEEDIK